MNRQYLSFKLFIIGLFMIVFSVSAQDSVKIWNLRQCIDYARANNIQVKSLSVTNQLKQVDYRQAKAQLQPSLGFSTNQVFTNQKDFNQGSAIRNSALYSGNYGLNAGYMVYDGGKICNTIKQERLLSLSTHYDVMQGMNDIEISVTQAYLQILYLDEALKNSQLAVDNSATLMERAKAFYLAGALAQSAYAQITAQYNSDKYQQVVTENNLAQAVLSLKQLLELDADYHLQVFIPAIKDVTFLQPLPPMISIYQQALQWVPQIQSRALQIESGKLGVKIAKANRLPVIKMNAAVSTGHSSADNSTFTKQLDERLNESIGLTLTMPIFDNRNAKSSIERASLQLMNNKLMMVTTQKNLLNTIETLYLDVLSAQSKYAAALENEKSYQLSYNLISEQFSAGLKNTVDLLIAKNNFLTAQQQLVQAKYQAVFALKILSFYQQMPIDIQ